MYVWAEECFWKNGRVLNHVCLGPLFTVTAGSQGTDYRYTWYVAFPSMSVLRWLGPMSLQPVVLVTTLVSPFPIFMDSFLYLSP